jgi:hypothetical protein
VLPLLRFLPPTTVSYLRVPGRQSRCCLQYFQHLNPPAPQRHRNSWLVCRRAPAPPLLATYNSFLPPCSWSTAPPLSQLFSTFPFSRAPAPSLLMAIPPSCTRSSTSRHLRHVSNPHVAGRQPRCCLRYFQHLRAPAPQHHRNPWLFHRRAPAPSRMYDEQRTES